LNHPALDSPLILLRLFLVLASCFRHFVVGRFVHLSWLLHRKTPSLLLLGIFLSKLDWQGTADNL
jgi:hypothetical protein